MSKLFAQFISTVINPLVVLCILPYILVLKTTGDLSRAYFWGIFSLFFILVFSVFFLIGIEKKYFSDLDVSKRSQRPLLFTFAIALSAIYVSFLYFLKAPEVLFIVIVGLIFGLISMEFVNRITKVSIHVATIAAFAMGLTLGFSPIFALSFLLVPLVAWSRIKTHNHTKRQAAVGALMGITITVAIYVIFKIFG